MKSTKAVAEEVQLKMIEAYQAGLTLKEAEDRYGYSEGACWRALQRHGVSSRLRSDSRRRYAVNESFFDVLDTEDKAYWLGFLSADGGIVRNRLVLILQEADAEHVSKFQGALSAQHPIIRLMDRGKNYVRITIYSERLVQSLSRHGVTRKKSFTIKPCQQIRPYLARHYWRGVVDGDGWISRHACGNHWTVALSGNYCMVEGFRQFVAGHVLSKATPRPSRNIFRIAFTGTLLPRTVASVLYQGATVSLRRKEVLARELLCGRDGPSQCGTRVRMVDRANGSGRRGYGG